MVIAWWFWIKHVGEILEDWAQQWKANILINQQSLSQRQAEGEVLTPCFPWRWQQNENEVEPKKKSL